MRNELIESVFGRDGADARDVGVLAVETVRAVTAVLEELKPLVGEIATRALYQRSLHLSRLSIRRSNSANSETLPELLHSLQLDIAAREPLDAQRASRALLHSLADLLTSLIGENLTHRMLRTAWERLPPEPGAEDSRK